MIAIKFDKGQGLGNQLWCYVTARVIALDRNLEFGIECPEYFKGSDFLSFDFSLKARGITKIYNERKILHPLNGTDIRLYDEKLIKVNDNTLIDGLLQDERYIAHRKDEIREWFNLDPKDDCRDFSDDTICVINFRGTGYVNDKDLFLSPSYWNNAIENMKKINPCFKFIVVTEDTINARRFFPNLEIYHWNIGKDFSVIKNAKYLILSNSSFAWFPAWLSTELKYCIAPKYWARHNVSDGFWCLGYNITSGWMYQDRKGTLFDYETCKNEQEQFISDNPHIYSNSSFKPSMLKTGPRRIQKTCDIVQRFWNNKSHLEC